VAVHDYSLANQDGASFRSDLNNALAAIVSNNSSSTEPASTYPYMWWADTNTATLKLRDSSDSSWITVGALGSANLGLLTTSSASSTYMAKAGGTFTGAVTLGNAASLVFEGATDNDFETTLAVTDPTADRTLTLPNATSTLAGLAITQSFTKAQRGTITSFSSSSGTATPDFAAANNFSITLSENTTLANPSNLTAGQSGVIFITQDSTARTLSFGSYWDFSGGNPPTISTGSGAVDALAYAVRTTTSIHATLLTNFS
jgi:hypothetical protein